MTNFLPAEDGEFNGNETPLEFPMDERACAEAIDAGETAYGLLKEANPALIRRFHRLNTTMMNLLADVQQSFPDACYFTGGGGFNILLGPAQDERGNSNRDLVAVCGTARISDGDF